MNNSEASTTESTWMSRDVLLSDGALATSVGTGIFLNSRLNSLNDEFEKVVSHLSQTIKKSTKHDKDINVLAESIRNISKQMKGLTEMITELNSMIVTRESTTIEAISEIQSILESQGKAISNPIDSFATEHISRTKRNSKSKSKSRVKTSDIRRRLQEETNDEDESDEEPEIIRSRDRKRNSSKKSSEDSESETENLLAQMRRK
jgi:hypothetical protein